MGDSGEYQGSQAFAQQTTAVESVNRNTGSLNVSYAVIALRGIVKSIGLSVDLSYDSGLSGSFGLPQNWTFSMSFVVPGKSLTVQGKTYVIDRNWADSTGYASGLKYINNHGMKFDSIDPPQSLPSGQPGYYSWRFQQTDGAVDYFDQPGKLLEHDDLFGNYIYYSYTDPGASPQSATIDSITDSWGQTVKFGYQPGSLIVVTAPDGGETEILFSQQGVQQLTDPVGKVTLFSYEQSGSGWILSSIEHPTGLVSRFFYQAIAYRDASGSPGSFPAVQDHYQLDGQGTELSRTNYRFGEATSNCTYTGYAAGYRMGDSRDSLMEHNDQDYRYDVLVLNLDSNNKILSASRVFFNYLHLPMQEFHYAVDSQGNISDALLAEYTYDIPEDEHARATNYTHPVITVQSHYNTTLSPPSYQPLRRAKAVYDDFGCTTQMCEEVWDSTLQNYAKQRTIVSNYAPVNWGGEMLQAQIFQDEVSGFLRQVIYTLTDDQKSVKTMAVQYRAKTDSDYKPWKTKTYSYDIRGRITAETVAWTQGALPPEETVASYTHNINYACDVVHGSSIVTTTDPKNNQTVTIFSTQIRRGPLIQRTLPLHQTETFEYDQIGRPVAYTDPMKNKQTTSYEVGASANTVTATSSLGYVTRTTFDVLGRQLRVEDNGDSTQPSSPTPSRILSKKTYDALSRTLTATDELGLVTTYNEYDGFNRQLKVTDPLGNESTQIYDDNNLTAQRRLNGDLRAEVQLDGLGRQIKTTAYADSGDATIKYCLVRESSYDGFDKVISSSLWQKPLDGSSAIQLETCKREYNVEYVVSREIDSGKSDLEGAGYDSLERSFEFDIFGNVYTYSKSVQYSGQTSLTHQGPKNIYDSCGRLVTVRNQLGKEESYTYDANGYVTGMVRLDGTHFECSTDDLGRVIGVTAPSLQIEKTYLANGRISKFKRSGDTVEYKYALDGSATGVVFSDGSEQSYTLDHADRIVEDQDALGIVRKVAFDEQGRVASRICYGDSINYTYDSNLVNHTRGMLVADTITGTQNLHRTVSYDGFGRPNHVTVWDTNSSQTVLDAIYMYDGKEKLQKVELSSQKFSTSRELNYQRTFTYDGLGQVRIDKITYTPTSSTTTREFSYDANSNVVSITTDGTARLMAYNAIDQRAEAAFNYDANGRLLSDDKGRSYEYSTDDQLNGVTLSGDSSRFEYYPNGAMSAHNTAATQTNLYYDGGAINAIRGKADSKDKGTSLLLEPGRLLAAYRGEPNSHTYYVESQGSTSLLLGQGGDVALDYQCYGTVDSSGGAQVQEQFGYRQEFTDSMSGLVYLRSRFYQPDLAAFITMDSSHKENRYAFCRGDPINRTDGTGHADTAAIIGMAVGTVVAIGVGVVTGGWGAAVFGPECLEASMSVAALSGAAGSISGDGFQAAAKHEPFTVERGAEDLISGAIGGAVGAGSGGFAGTQAMELAISGQMSLRAMTTIGFVTSSVVGGAAGGFATSASMAAMNGQAIFSSSTALSAVSGALGGAIGGIVQSGTYLGFTGQCIPVRLKSVADFSTITPAIKPEGISLTKSLYVMAPQAEAEETMLEFQSRFNRGRAAQRLDPSDRDGREFDTIAAHGRGDSIFVSVKYRTGNTERVYMRAMPAKLFAQHMQEVQARGEFGTGGDSVKLMICRAANGNGQMLANALQRNAFASYEVVDPFSTTTRWHELRPQ